MSITTQTAADRVSENEAALDIAILAEVDRSLRENPAASAGEASKSAMAALVKNEDYIGALATRLAIKWLEEEAQASSVLKFFDCDLIWQLLYLLDLGLVTRVESPKDIAANSSCVGFLAASATPALLAAVEQLRSPSASPVLIVPRRPSIWPPHPRWRELEGLPEPADGR